MNLRKVAYHEAGHFIVAENYKLRPFVMVKQLKENASPYDDDGWTGANFNEETNNHFHAAVVGWAGMIADHIPALDDAGWNGKNGGLHLDAMYKMFFEIAREDEADRQLVCRLPPEQRRGAMDVAWSIIRRNIKELRKVAEYLIETRAGTGNLEMFFRNMSLPEKKVREMLAGQPEHVVEHFLKLNENTRQQLESEKG